VFFFLYLFSSFGASLLLGSFFNDKNFFFIVFFSFTIFITPAQISVDSSDYAPALFAFIFNSILEQDYSLRVLRPLMLSIPISLLIWYAGLMIKRRSF